MAAWFSSSPPRIIIQTSSAIKKPDINGRAVMLKQSSPFPVMKTTLKLQIRSSYSSSSNKVFEDGSRGIVCYRDDSGEIVCEGYDEGPRFHLQVPSSSSSSSSYHHPRCVEMVDLLQKSWLQIGGGGEFNGHSHKKDVAAQDDFNWNGFSTFC
ncbi:uncharacterized protein LOC131167135 [Malania oleifera]|uniref:uncharacterized protein LOC131167135 n=1 Tax=Malania oleifera TaxID=397392 RepID=UPI0025AE6BA2|nr:uncharacterized protein LOC131167135 [Malania oleifera]